MPVLLVSFWLRVTLIAAGGQFYWPDEKRYLHSRQAAEAILAADFKKAAADLYRPDHFLFKVFGVIPAVFENISGPDPRIPAYFLAMISTLNIWLIWKIALSAGARRREAFIVACLLACSNSFFYYTRHLLPYDLATMFGFLALLAALKHSGNTAAAFICGLSAAGAILAYTGSWALAGFAVTVGVVWHPFSIQNFFKRLVFSGIGLVAPFLAIHAAYFCGGFGNRWLQSLAVFSRSITQGSYEEGWRLPFEYLWHSEHLLLVAWCAALVWCLWEVKNGNRSRRVLLGIAGVVFIYSTLALFSVGLKMFVVYGRLARQLVPFFCILMGYCVERLFLAGKKARIAASLACGLIVIQAAFNLRRPLSQVFPPEFLARAGEYLSRAGEDNFAVLYAHHLIPKKSSQPPAEPMETIISAQHPLQFLPYQYEGYDQEQRRWLRSHDIGMRLVILSRQDTETLK